MAETADAGADVASRLDQRIGAADLRLEIVVE
jgi:hypothetical protein